MPADQRPSTAETGNIPLPANVEPRMRFLALSLLVISCYGCTNQSPPASPASPSSSTTLDSSPVTSTTATGNQQSDVDSSIAQDAQPTTSTSAAVAALFDNPAGPLAGSNVNIGTTDGAAFALGEPVVSPAAFGRIERVAYSNQAVKMWYHNDDGDLLTVQSTTPVFRSEQDMAALVTEHPESGLSVVTLPNSKVSALLMEPLAATGIDTTHTHSAVFDVGVMEFTVYIPETQSQPTLIALTDELAAEAGTVQFEPPPSVLASTKCPENTASNTFQPEQVIPSTADPGAIVGFHIGVWPEGVEVDVGDPSIMNPTAALTAAFETAKALVPSPLPALLPQPCCPGGAVLTIRFANGQRAAYGPCLRPSPIDEIINKLYDAYNQN